MDTRITKELQTVQANARVALLLSKKELAEACEQNAHLIETQASEF
jgi:hypothetical protein